MFSKSIFWLFLFLLPATTATAFQSAKLEALPRGKILFRTALESNYQLYIPRRAPKRILVIVHGTPSPTESVDKLSEKFIKRWVDFANTKRLLLISIGFNQRNFGSVGGKYGYGGYRGLFGRTKGADDFTLELVDKYSKLCKVQDGRFLLYGHSAGGQFAIRFCVRHPNRMAGVVASAPGRFAFPDKDVRWPHGMKKFDRVIKWSVNESKKTVVTPAADGWTKAAKLPIYVVYGKQDTEPQPKRSAHPGTTRIDFGTGWVNAMNALNLDKKKTIKLKIVPEIGHSSSRLTKRCQAAFSQIKWAVRKKVAPKKTKSDR